VVFRGPVRWTIRRRPATNGDAIINKIDLQLDDPAVQNSAVYEAEQADLNGATADYRPQGQSGAGTADIRRGQNVTFWVDSTSDGYSDLAFRYKDAGAAGVTVNGLSLGGGLDGARGGNWSTRTDRVYLSAGINKVVVTGYGGEVTLDKLTVTPVQAPQPDVATYQAEGGTLTGTAQVSNAYDMVRDNDRGTVVT